jgi:hypothetical protein
MVLELPLHAPDPSEHVGGPTASDSMASGRAVDRGVADVDFYI